MRRAASEEIVDNKAKTVRPPMFPRLSEDAAREQIPWKITGVTSVYSHEVTAEEYKESNFLLLVDIVSRGTHGITITRTSFLEPLAKDFAAQTSFPSRSGQVIQSPVTFASGVTVSETTVEPRKPVLQSALTARPSYRKGSTKMSKALKYSCSHSGQNRKITESVNQGVSLFFLPLQTMGGRPLTAGRCRAVS
jgi:hypothetical protein